MDRQLLVVCLCLACIGIGAGGMRMWQWSEYVDALERERGLVTERDRLVTELATVKAQRDTAQAKARQERQAIYDGDKDAATWARQPVPRAIAERVQRAARNADAAASTTSSGRVSNPAG
jgi:hypothetical protein